MGSRKCHVSFKRVVKGFVPPRHLLNAGLRLISRFMDNLYDFSVYVFEKERKAMDAIRV